MWAGQILQFRPFIKKSMGRDSNVHVCPLEKGTGSKLVKILVHVVVECPLPQWIHSPAIKSSTSALSSSFLDCNCNVLESST